MKMLHPELPLDLSFNHARIESIVDKGIQEILLKHLNNHDDNPEIAFSPEGIDEMNMNIVGLNNGKLHQPILKVRTYETKGNKFAVGKAGNKKWKYVETAKGTNLFFAVYADGQGKRSYNTIPYNIAIERQKQGLLSVPETNDLNHHLLFYLSPNDLVYVTDAEENANLKDFNFTNAGDTKIYRIVSFTGNRLYGIPCNVGVLIVEKLEYTSANKLELSLEKISIKENCIKLKTDRLGHLSLA